MPNSNVRASSGGVFTYGLPTPQIPTSGSATFTGTAAGLYFSQSSTGAFSSDSVKLVADFQTNRMGGAITNVVSTADGARFSDIYFTPGPISSAGFTGSVTTGLNASNPTLSLSAPTGSFSGQFNGPNAAEASGTFFLRSGESGYRLTGAFAASGQATPAGQTAPVPPVTPTTLASVPAGSRFVFDYGSALNAFDIHSSSTGTGAPTGTFLYPRATVATTSDGFSLTLPDAQTGVFKTSAGIAGPNGGRLFNADIPGGSISRSVRFMAGSPLAYAAYGAWDELATPSASFAPGTPAVPGTSRTGAVSGGVLVYGIYSNQIPTLGSATYTGGVTGLYFLPGDSGAIVGGSTRLVADFTQRSVAGAITNITGQSSLASGTGTLSDIFFKGAFDGGVAFGGSAVGGANVSAADLSTATGSVSGAFYGPQGAEVAGVVNLTDTALGIGIAAAFGGSGVITPNGQPTPSVPGPPALGLSTTLATLPAGFSFENTSSTINAPPFYNYVLPVPLGGGDTNTDPNLYRVTQTSSGRAFRLVGYSGSISLGAADKGPLGYFGPFKDTAGASAGMAHIAENPLTYSSYGTWALSKDTAPAARPGLESTTSRVGVFVYGIETAVAQMPTTGAATYRGGMAGQFAAEGIGSGVVTGGNLTLTADFAARKVDGAITNITAVRLGAAPGVADRLNDIVLAPSTFTARTFSGIAAALATPGATIDLRAAQIFPGPECPCYGGGGLLGTYNGGFYGPNAAEIAGAIRMQDGFGRNVLQGSFAGAK